MITRITDAGCPTVHQLGTTGPSYNPSALHSNARLTSDVLCAHYSPRLQAAGDLDRDLFRFFPEGGWCMKFGEIKSA
jgi:hypothetical protein